MNEQDKDPLDGKILLQLQALAQKGKPGFLARIAGRLVQDGPQHIAAVHRAVQQGDTAALAREAHTFKGSCLVLGATSLAQACRALEMSAREGDLPAATLLVGALEAEWERVRERCETLS